MPTDKPKKLNLKSVSHLPDAIIDGKLQCGLQSTIIVERVRSKKTNYCECIVKQVAANGIVTLWDDTLEQWYVIDLKDPPPFVKILKQVSDDSQQ
jgi:hypothetical protein